MGERRKSPEKDVTTISIPKSLYNKVKERIKDTEFASVSSYVEYVLKELLAEQTPEEPLSKEDEEKIKARLKALGYID